MAEAGPCSSENGRGRSSAIRMMCEDRPRTCHRGMLLETHSIPKAVKKLLILNIGIYIGLRITGLYGWGLEWFSLIPAKITQHGQAWRLFTYLFLHANIFWHLIFNMFALWMFGPEIERRLGTPRFIFYYFLTGIGGGLCSLIIAPKSGAVTIGASGSIFGLLVAFAMLFPNAIISLIFPPISMKAKNFVIVFGIIQFFMLFEGPAGVSWIIHLGGMLIGYLYLRHTITGGRFFNWQNIRQKLFQRRRMRRDYFIEEEVNPILDKISKVGINGLTRRERWILKKARHKI